MESSDLRANILVKIFAVPIYCTKHQSRITGRSMIKTLYVSSATEIFPPCSSAIVVLCLKLNQAIRRSVVMANQESCRTDLKPSKHFHEF